MSKITFFLFTFFIAGLSWQASAQTYCYAEGNDTNWEHIKNVKYAGIDNTTSTHPGYNDFTDQIANVVREATNLISVNLEGGDAFIFIDWNQDGVLNDPGEIYSFTTGGLGLHTTNITVPVDALLGNTRMRVLVNDANSPIPCLGLFTYGEVEDYTVNVTGSAVACPSPSGLSAALSLTSANLNWVDNAGASTWNIEYGAVGFTPGTGTEVTGITSKPYNLTGLTTGNSYDFYVQSVCNVSDESAWAGPYTFTLDYCGVSSMNGEYFTQINTTGAVTNISYTASALPTGGYADETAQILEVFTAQVVEITTGYSNSLVDNGVNIWVDWDNDFTFDATEIVATEVGGNGNNTLLVEIPAGTPEGDYRMRMRSSGGANPDPAACGVEAWGSTVDFTLNVTSVCPPATGDTTAVVCGDFEWYGTTYTNSGTATHTLVAGANNGCDSIVTLNLTINPENVAGDNNSITVCMNEPLDLATLLSSGADAGGEWLDPAGAPLTNSLITTSEVAGIYVYSYVASSADCPDVTAEITITVDEDCDYLAVTTEGLMDVSVYPNPTRNVLNIVNPSNTSSLHIELLDMNGRVVLVENNTLKNATEVTLAIDHLEQGMYTLRLHNGEGQRTFKIVKQ